jgi:hypothetical protein
LTIYRYTIEDLTKIIDTLNDSCKKDPWFLTKFLWLLQKDK